MIFVLKEPEILKFVDNKRQLKTVAYLKTQLKLHSQLNSK